ncbi:hypothetical protein TNCV_5141811 [Trichonephila clavipes]|nr:hypothetical protein TNCV_5141811 [Trichonephila clavipes]
MGCKRDDGAEHQIAAHVYLAESRCRIHDNRRRQLFSESEALVPVLWLGDSILSIREKVLLGVYATRKRHGRARCTTGDQKRLAARQGNFCRQGSRQALYMLPKEALDLIMNVKAD